uniref:MSP domain-containing protein n=1 Tax=Caenorhabditis japonica TaxID=281687 RepID=A0A8R1HMZ7_CAEJA
MGVELSLDPPVCPIQAHGGTSKHKMINHTDRHLAYKIKSSNNSHYSVNLIFGILKVCEVKELVITRKAGKPQADKLIIQYCQINDENADPKPLFANGVPPGELSGETTIKLSAAE